MIGLYSEDIWCLIGVLDWLVDVGNIVLIIEYNLDVVKLVDYLIDLGLEGGDGGGIIVVIGILEQVVEVVESYIG